MSKALAVVLNSGGLHSLVATALASREYRVAMVHIKDGRACEDQALAAFERQVAHFKPAKHWIIEAPYLREMSLPPETAGLIHSTGSDPHSNLIPLRDVQYLTIAAGFAKQLHAPAVLWGMQVDQKQTEPLARTIEMAQVYNQMLELHSPEPAIVLKTPLLGLEDQQVVELGYQMAVPFTASWTCQMPIEFPCMSCPACARRIRAFRAAQLSDPLGTKPKHSVVA